MNDTPSLEQLTKSLLAFRDARDWAQFHSPKNLAMSVGIEAGELLEIFQWLADDAPLSASQHEKVADEAADVLIYLLLLCEKTGVDLARSAAAKIERNHDRFPVARIEADLGSNKGGRK